MGAARFHTPHAIRPGHEVLSPTRRRGGPLVAWTAIWYFAAVLCVITSKLILQVLPGLVWTLTFAQFMITLVCCRLQVLARYKASCMQRISRRQRVLVIGEGLSVYMGLVLTNAALGCTNANLVETIKALEPIPTVIFAMLVVGEQTSDVERFALAIVVVGIMMMSYQESTLVLVGIASTLGANCMFALANNISKISFSRSDSLDALNFWYRAVQVGAVLAAPAAFSELRSYGSRQLFEVPNAPPMPWILAMVLLNGCAFYTYNRATCEVLVHVTMTCHSVLNTLRRAVMIIATAFYFGSPVSVLNLFGAGVAALGFIVFWAQKQKRQHQVPAPVLQVLSDGSKW